MASDRRVLAALLCLSAIYLWQFAFDGWIPHDDGMLAQIAERVMAGEMPHRDFDDPYTGLLGYLHGLGFLTFGISLRSIRLVLFLFTLAWLPAMYVLARHFVAPLGAGLVTALALTWTLPNYFAAVPFYYNLFLATFGMVALARHVDTDRRYWLGIAGACGGLAFLIKSAGGFYFTAAALLFLVCRERETVSHGTDHPPASSAPSRLRDQAFTPLLLVKLLGAALTVIVLLKLLPRQEPMELLHFVLPGTLVALVIWRNETRGLPGAFGHRICACGLSSGIRPGVRRPGAVVRGALFMVRLGRRLRHRRFRSAGAALRTSQLCLAAAHNCMARVAVRRPPDAGKPTELAAAPSERRNAVCCCPAGTRGRLGQPTRVSGCVEFGATPRNFRSRRRLSADNVEF